MVHKYKSAHSAREYHPFYWYMVLQKYDASKTNDQIPFNWIHHTGKRLTKMMLTQLIICRYYIYSSDHICPHWNANTLIWSTAPYHKNHITSCFSSSGVCTPAHMQFELQKSDTLNCSQQEEALFLHPISVAGQGSSNEKHLFTWQ